MVNQLFKLVEYKATTKKEDKINIRYKEVYRIKKDELKIVKLKDILFITYQWFNEINRKALLYKIMTRGTKTTSQQDPTVGSIGKN